MPDLVKGYDLMLYSGTPGRREGRSWSPVKVVTIGPKYVGVIPVDRYEAYVADAPANRWWVRKFLREDWHEGERGKRIGYTAMIGTREQAEFDARLAGAMRFVRDVAGLDTRMRSMFDPRQHPGRLIVLGEVLAELLAEFGIEPEADNAE